MTNDDNNNKPCLKVGEIVELAGVKLEVNASYSLNMLGADGGLPEAVYKLWNVYSCDAEALFPKAKECYACHFPDFKTLEDLTEAVELVREKLERNKNPEVTPEPVLAVGQVWRCKRYPHNTITITEFDEHGDPYTKESSRFYKKTILNCFILVSNPEVTPEVNLKPEVKPEPEPQPKPLTLPESIYDLDFEWVEKPKANCPKCGGNGVIRPYPTLEPEFGRKCDCYEKELQCKQVTGRHIVYMDYHKLMILTTEGIDIKRYNICLNTFMEFRSRWGVE